MKHFKLLTLTTILLTSGLIACSGDDDGDDTTVTPPGMSLQAQAVESGQVNYSDGAGLSISQTLAIDVSGASIGAPTQALPGAFAAADYYGAVDPAAAMGWWQGWTYINSGADGTLPGDNFHPLEAEITGGTITPAGTNDCATVNADFGDGGTVMIFGATFPVCVLSQDITADTTLPNTHVYVLAGTISVGTGMMQLSGGSPSSSATLTIQAGVQIFAAEGQASSLVITRGSRIAANGTSDLPIILSAVAVDGSNNITGDPTNLLDRGVWGGLVLSGMARENSGDTNGELTTEAAPPDAERWFGGMMDSDNSGTVRYMVIAESGYEFRPDEEVQGLTLEAVGSGTILEYIQVIGSEDDCVEWFGGAVDVSYLICNGVDDDALDMDEGFSGNVQFVIVRMGSDNGDRGIESDGNGSNFDAQPYTAPNLANVTILGNPGREDGNTSAILHREGWRGKVYRSVFTDDMLGGGGFESGCLDIDDVVPSALAHYDSVFNCTGGPLIDDDDAEE